MSETQSPHSEPIEAIEALDRKLPLWGPELVVAVAIAIDVVLPSKLTVGPSWLLPTLEGVLLVGLIVASPHPYVRHSPAAPGRDRPDRARQPHQRRLARVAQPLSA